MTLHREITDDQLLRYARHIILDEVGEEGQLKLLNSKVLVVGAGGLGSPVLLYLAAAGVGTLGVIDFDTVDISNLQRQILHATDRVGVSKVDSAVAAIKAVNPEVIVREHKTRLTAENAAELIAEYDLVTDGSDNFATRYLVNDACHLARRPLVAGALQRFEGQLSTFKSYLGGENPCYRCLFPNPPPPSMTASCETAGIFGSIAGVIGTTQATEILKELLGLGESMSGSLLLFDALNTTFRKIKIPPDPACPLCGSQPTITSLQDSEEVQS
jgi:molybdopterin/thiamine biosynthesis adenylyltransferase